MPFTPQRIIDGRQRNLVQLSVARSNWGQTPSRRSETNSETGHVREACKQLFGSPLNMRQNSPLDFTPTKSKDFLGSFSDKNQDGESPGLVLLTPPKEYGKSNTALIPSRQYMVVNAIPHYEQLACFDDYATALVVDPILGFSTHKMSSQWRSLRSKKSTIEPIICEYRLSQDAELTFNRLMECHPHWFKYFISVKSPQQFKIFKLHVIRYIHIQHPLSGFMISVCHRFSTHDRKECKIRVTKKWCAGEFITKLCGIIAEMSSKEEAKFITPGVNDFSVMYSTRKNISQLWLGPAAYINHDCKPNCKFVFMSREVACVQLLRDMDVGDEVLVYYGDFFFGENNEHCGCKTCEREGRGLFSTTTGPKETGVQIKGEDRSYSLRATNQRSNPRRYSHLSLFLTDDEEDSIYNIIPKPVIRDDGIIFAKPMLESSQEQVTSRECRALRSDSMDSKSSRESKFSTDSVEDSKEMEVADGTSKKDEAEQSNQCSRSDSDSRSTRSSKRFNSEHLVSTSSKRDSSRVRSNVNKSSVKTGLFGKGVQKFTPFSKALAAKSSLTLGYATPKSNLNRKRCVAKESSRKQSFPKSSPRKRTRSCVLQLVDQRKSAALRLSEMCMLTAHSHLSTNHSTSHVSCELYLSRDGEGMSSDRLLRSSASPSPGSVCSNSDILFRQVSVPPSDRVLRKRS